MLISNTRPYCFAYISFDKTVNLHSMFVYFNFTILTLINPTIKIKTKQNKTKIEKIASSK